MKRCGLEARMIGWGSEGSGVGDEEGEGSSSKARLEGKGKGKGYELEEGEQWLECRVVEEQPLLWVKKSSLTHGTVMLYDGERYVASLACLAAATPRVTQQTTAVPAFYIGG